METVQTPIANRIIEKLIYGNRENEKKPLYQNLDNTEERLARFKRILEMK
jgi:hypothetical protein